MFFFFLIKKFEKLKSKGSGPNWLGLSPGSVTPVTWLWASSLTFLNFSFLTYKMGDNSVHLTVLLVKIKQVNIYKAYVELSGT